MNPETMMIDDVKYVRADSINETVKKMDGMNYCLVRSSRAGVFAGYVESRTGSEVVLRNSRGIWYWSGACGLSQLATDGTSAPNDCKFTVVVNHRIVIDVIEVILCTAQAQKTIHEVPIWEK